MNNKSLYQTNNTQQIVDLSCKEQWAKIGRDLFNSKIIGEIQDWDFPSSNYQCEFDGVRLDNVRFNSKDFRDCTFKQSTFENCYFRESSIIGCTFIDCKFINTKIESYSIHDCIYVGTNFLNSTIKGSMIRYSRAQSCLFSDCLLDNKIFDECLLFDVEFISTNIDFGILTDNFGVSSNLLPTELIRENRSYQLGNERMVNFGSEELSKLQKSLSAIESFRLQCYFSGDLLFHGPIIDNILSVDNWVSSISTPSAFIRLITNLSEFVIREFNQNRCYLHFLLRVHYMMYRIYDSVSETYPSIAQTAIGVHHRLGIIFSEYEHTVLELSPPHNHQLKFLTDGDFDIPEIQKTLDKLRVDAGEFEYSLGPRNSPVLLEILSDHSLIAAIFVFTRLNLEIANIAIKNDNGTLPVLGNRKRLAIRAGDGRFSLTASGIGDLMIKASIGIDTELIRKIRKVLYKILLDTE